MKREPMWRDPKWRLAVFRRTMTHLSAALVLSALIAGAYRERVYFMFAACAAGTILFARAWRAYCRGTGPDPARSRRDRKVPFMLAKKKAAPHKPAFRMTAADFDDDLTPDTAADEEAFTERQRLFAHVAACVCAGAVMIALSVIL